MKKIILILAVLLIAGCSDYKTSEQCKADCLASNYDDGRCEWPRFMDEISESLFSEVKDMGSCLIEKTKHCGSRGACNCYCTKNKDLVACTEDAKICADGSAVGRIPPDCEFAPCPVECYTDDDCVPASCCHPSGCTVASRRPNCNDIMCTMNCEPGTLDCGQGSCQCIDNQCQAVIETNPDFELNVQP